MGAHKTDRRASKDSHRMSNSRPKPEQRDGRRDVLAIRRDYWDHGMRLETVVQKWAEYGRSQQYVEDVVFYRIQPSLMPQDRTP